MNQRLIQYFINELEYDSLFDYVNVYICLGNMDAVCLMGDLYYYGIGVNDDLEIAKEYYHKAAKAGHVLARDRLGEIYYVNAEYIYSYAVETLNNHPDKGKSALKYAYETYKKSASYGYLKAYRSLNDKWFNELDGCDKI